MKPLRINLPSRSALPRLVWPGAILGALLASLSSSASDKPDATSPTDTKPRKVTVKVVTPSSAVLKAHLERQAASAGGAAVDGQKVHVDPSTRRIREASPQDEKELAAAAAPLFNRSTEELRPVVHANGMISIALEGRFQEASLARLNPDGSVSQACVNQKAQATRFFTVPAPQSRPGTGKEASDVQ